MKHDSGHLMQEIHKLEHYIYSTILPAVHKPGASFTLQPTDLGNRNVIFFFTIENLPPLILKGYRKKSRFKKALRGSRLLAQHGINVPHLYFSDSAQTCFREFGCYLVCEEKIAGKSLAEFEDIKEFVPSVARCYAQLHRAREPHWKSLFSVSLLRYRSSVMSDMEERLDYLDRWNPQRFSSKTMGSCRTWFYKRKASLNSLQGFSLCHGDVNRKNIIISESGDIFLIDPEAVKFAPFLLEFYRLELNLCEDRLDVIELFDTIYCKHADKKALEELKQCGEFFKAYVLLECACYFTKKRRQVKADEPLQNYYIRQGEKVFAALNEMIKGE